MKVYRDLRLNGDRHTLGQLVTTMLASLPSGWTQDSEAEHQLHGEFIAISCPSTSDHPKATAFLTYTGENALEVTNVLSSEVTELSHDAYNLIVQEFAEQVVAPIAKNLGVKVELGKSETDLEDYMSPETADLLRRFSGTANKSTGSSHPRDQERWHVFLIAAHNEDASLEASTLMEWLIDHEGWSADRASDLAVEYEKGRSLLQQYDKS